MEHSFVNLIVPFYENRRFIIVLKKKNPAIYPSNPVHTHTHFFFNIHFHIFLPVTPTFSKLYLPSSLRFK